MPHRLQMFHRNHSLFDEGSSSVLRSWSDRLGSHCNWSRVRISFNICERETSYCWIRSPYIDHKTSWMTISNDPRSIPVWVAYWKSPGPQNKTFIRRASPGVSYKLRDKNAVCRRRWNITTQERKISFVVNGSVKLTIPTQPTAVNLGKKQKWCSLWFPWSQVQQDTSGRDSFRILGCLWTINHRCVCKWDRTEMLTVSFPLRAKTVCIPLRMNIERCRREEGHNSYPLECRLFAGRLFLQNHENIVN